MRRIFKRRFLPVTLKESLNPPDQTQNESTPEPDWEDEWDIMGEHEALRWHEENVKTIEASIKEKKSRDKTQFKRS